MKIIIIKQILLPIEKRMEKQSKASKQTKKRTSNNNFTIAFLTIEIFKRFITTYGNGTDIVQSLSILTITC